MIRIIIELEGGLVKNVFCPDWPDAEVCVIDWDALDTSDLTEDTDFISSTGPVDKWDDAGPLVQQIVAAVEREDFMTVAQVREILYGEAQKIVRKAREEQANET